ncbi:MFS transporter, partial [Francisella tularensis subsp. holarctica]|nr:MFS transporter [Francisella tularensis subsp. holarctica]
MYSVIDHEKLDSVNTKKNSGNMISSSFALTIFTLVYDIYHNFGMYHHCLQIFEQAYLCVVAKSAVVQLIMVVWISLRMDN